MERLVDEDILVKIIDKHTKEQNELDDDITCILEEVPTAYDVESVVNEIHKYFAKVIDDSDSDNIPLEVLEYNKAICEIVRTGGVK